MKRYRVKTNHLVFFEKNNILECNDSICYKRREDQTNCSLPVEIVENNPLWFEEITEKDKKCIEYQQFNSHTIYGGQDL